jgi:hypothetical protein
MMTSDAIFEHDDHSLKNCQRQCRIKIQINHLKPTYWLRDEPSGLTFNNFTLCPHSICVLYLSENKQRFLPLTA